MASSNVGAGGNPLAGAGYAPPGLAIYFEPSWLEYVPHWVSAVVSAVTLGITIAKLWKGRKGAADDIDLEAAVIEQRNQRRVEDGAHDTAFTSATSDSGQHTNAPALRTGKNSSFA